MHKKVVIFCIILISNENINVNTVYWKWKPVKSKHNFDGLKDLYFSTFDCILETQANKAAEVYVSINSSICMNLTRLLIWENVYVLEYVVYFFTIFRRSNIKKSMTCVKDSKKYVNMSSLECICNVFRYSWSSIPLLIVRRRSSHWQAGSSITVWLSHHTLTQTNIIDESSRWDCEKWVTWKLSTFCVYCDFGMHSEILETKGLNSCPFFCFWYVYCKCRQLL